MGKANFTDDFKRDAVHQITERGYPVAEVSKRLGVSQHSLYAWKKKFSEPSGDDDKDAEIRRLKRERIRRRAYKTRADARQDMFDYIQMFYNPQRKHTRNGMLLPVDFERKQKMTTEGV